jgi:hypothetical protein
MPQAPLPATARRRHCECDPKHCTPTHIPHTSAASKHMCRTSRTAATTVHCANITARDRAARTPHTAATTAQCTHTAARTPHTQHGTPLRPPHTPPTETPSHTNGLRATLTAELSGCPASTGCCRRVGCCTSLSTCRTHEQPSRHTTLPTPASHPQCIAGHRIASIESNRIKTRQHTACYRSHATPCASDPDPTQHHQTPHRYLRHCDTRASHNTMTAMPCTRKQALCTQQQHDDVW